MKTEGSLQHSQDSACNWHLSWTPWNLPTKFYMHLLLLHSILHVLSIIILLVIKTVINYKWNWNLTVTNSVEQMPILKPNSCSTSHTVNEKKRRNLQRLLPIVGNTAEEHRWGWRFEHQRNLPGIAVTRWEWRYEWNHYILRTPNSLSWVSQDIRTILPLTSETSGVIIEKF
jgi:hypothetical protein